MFAELDRMLRLGVIEPCAESEWNNPIHPVKKATGKIRLCLNAKALNMITKNDTYPVHHLERIISRLEKAKYFSQIDLADAFWQVPLAEASREKTSFAIIGRGKFRFKVMPFGCKNSSSCLARLLDLVVSHDLSPHCVVYCDDILILTNSKKHHIRMLEEVTKRLKAANLTINIDKSKFFAKTVRYLGFSLTEEGMQPSMERVKAVLNYSTPRKVKDIRRFLGAANFYRRFIENYSEITAPINMLLTNEFTRKRFKWTKEANEAFLKLKTALVSEPVLTNPNYELPFSVHTDSSGVAVAAALMQGKEEAERPVAYFSFLSRIFAQRETTGRWRAYFLRANESRHERNL